MTELEHPPEPARSSELAQWAWDARDAYQVARSLAGTSFVPQEMRGHPELVTACILTGQEMGLAPMAALQNIYLVNGVPALKATAMRGLVQAQGHEVWVDPDSDSERAVVYAQRKGSDKVQSSVWTLERAKALGWGEKKNYKIQPAVMLVARATAEVCRLVASDVLMGCPYAAEELEEPESKPKKMRRKPIEDHNGLVESGNLADAERTERATGDAGESDERGGKGRSEQT